MLIAENTLGCEDTARFNRILVVGFPGIWVPNAFTPNYDGHNEVFRIYGTGVVGFQCYLFNRWGELIYQWDSMDEGWDGNTPSGPAPMGQYVYRVEYDFGPTLERKVMIGSVSLIR